MTPDLNYSIFFSWVDSHPGRMYWCEEAALICSLANQFKYQQRSGRNFISFPISCLCVGGFKSPLRRDLTLTSRLYFSSWCFVPNYFYYNYLDFYHNEGRFEICYQVVNSDSKWSYIFLTSLSALIWSVSLQFSSLWNQTLILSALPATVFNIFQ